MKYSILHFYLVETIILLYYNFMSVFRKTRFSTIITIDN